MFKQIIKGKVGYFCDVCGKELSLDERVSLTIDNWFKDKAFHLCSKHGKLVQKYIKDLTTQAPPVPNGRA